MTALANISNLRFARNNALQNTFHVAASTTVAATDVLIGLNSGGFAGPLSTGTFTEWAGVLSANGRNPLPVTGSATASPDTAIVVDQGIELLGVDVTGLADEGDVGASVYASDNVTLTLTQGSNVKCGFVSNYNADGTANVQLFTPAQQKA